MLDSLKNFSGSQVKPKSELTFGSDSLRLAQWRRPGRSGSWSPPLGRCAFNVRHDQTTPRMQFFIPRPKTVSDHGGGEDFPAARSVLALPAAFHVHPHLRSPRWMMRR